MVPTRHRPIPESELQFAFSRSGGPGGQNVNRRETRVQLFFDVMRSSAFSVEQKVQVLNHPLVKHLLTNTGVLLIAADTHRTQHANVEDAIARLHDLMHRALAPKKKRKATKPTKGSKERRLSAKKRRSQTKARRRSSED